MGGGGGGGEGRRKGVECVRICGSMWKSSNEGVNRVKDSIRGADENEFRTCELDCYKERYKEQ